ncbi:MAG: P-loop NTPase [Candidatus Dormiibacterota bacterium]
MTRIVGDLEKLAPFAETVDVCGVAHQPTAVIEEAWLRQPDVLLLHETFADPSGADFAAHLGSVSPATRVLLMTSSEPADATAWVAGTIHDGADGTALFEAIRVTAGVIRPRGGAGAETSEPDAEAPPVVVPDREHHGRATLVVVFSGKGGSGTSMVATNLAVALAGSAEGRTVLIDSDLQFGDAAAMLHVESHLLTIADLAAAGEDIEAVFLDDVLATGPGEVRVLRSAPSPELADIVTASRLRAMIRAISTSYEFVVVDTPSHLDERMVEVFDLADRVLVVSSYNLTAVRSAKASIALLEALGVTRDRIGVVLNHTRPRVSFRREDVEEILGCRALADLPYDPRVDQSLDSGSPIVLALPHAELSRRLVMLAGSVSSPSTAPGTSPSEEPMPAPPPTYRRRFNLGRR